MLLLLLRVLSGNNASPVTIMISSSHELSQDNTGQTTCTQSVAFQSQSHIRLEFTRNTGARAVKTPQLGPRARVIAVRTQPFTQLLAVVHRPEAVGPVVSLQLYPPLINFVDGHLFV